MKNLSLLIVAILSLSACTTAMSTGITSNNSNQTVIEFPVETAMNNIYTKTRSEDLSTVMYGLKMAKEFTVMPKGTAVFNNQQVQSAEVVTVSKVEGQVVDKSVGVNYFTLDPLVFHGFTKDSGEYSIATQSAAIPKVASVGDSSTYLTENVYSDSSKSQQVEKFTQAWSLTQATRDTAWLRITSSENLLVGSEPDGTVDQYYRINSKGDLLNSELNFTYSTPDGFEIIAYMSE
ncbi:hypothetical protein ACTXJ2_12255 [Psychrobacter alimentarius]|uniref:hypothetical protein n=1 Tax=Psychrobacter TaxID=497 RepID=UPI000BAAD728|nr:hypothetical protein [Psychrobacter sp. JB193]PAT62542.1 hypothetical protein CIK80_08090 [Psychrobacter sp. JB193]